MVYISSIIPSTLLPSDIVLNPKVPEGQMTNLKTSSVLRLHKLATIHTTSLRRHLGKISAMIEGEVNAKLKVLLGL